MVQAAQIQYKQRLQVKARNETRNIGL
jgi:hypothetical protein